jgi:hypothetical protein
MQKALEVANNEEKGKLIDSFNRAIEQIKDLKIQNKWKKIIESYYV